MEFIVSILKELLRDFYVMAHEKFHAQKMAQGSFSVNIFYFFPLSSLIHFIHKNLHWILRFLSPFIKQQ